MDQPLIVKIWETGALQPSLSSGKLQLGLS
jgi:hypothetical protein